MTGLEEPMIRMLGMSTEWSGALSRTRDRRAFRIPPRLLLGESEHLFPVQGEASALGLSVGHREGARQGNHYSLEAARTVLAAAVL